MKKYIITFLHRGLIFGGFGPIITSIVFFILSLTLENFSLTSSQILISTLSTYFLAFIQSGSSVFNQIEGWSIGRSLLLHFSTLYFAYVSCYLVNSWIPKSTSFIIFFTAIFTLAYLAVWLTVYVSIRITSKCFNRQLNK
jgi:hypothetical protein